MTPKALIDLIGEFGRAVNNMIDDCETTADGEGFRHEIEGHHLNRVSDLLEQIETLPFEEPGVILGPGAMLQMALTQTFMKHQPLTAAQLADALGCFWNAAIGQAHHRESYEAMSTASIMADGIAAVQKRLEELS